MDVLLDLVIDGEEKIITKKFEGDDFYEILKSVNKYLNNIKYVTLQIRRIEFPN